MLVSCFLEMLPILDLTLVCWNIAHTLTVVAVNVCYTRRCADFVSDTIPTVVIYTVRGVVIHWAVVVVKWAVFVVEGTVVVVELTILVIEGAVVVVHGLLGVCSAACNKHRDDSQHKL